MITDWADLIELFEDMPHEAGIQFPEPRAGDVWIVESPFWNRENVENAAASQVKILLVGADTSLTEDAECVGVNVMLGDNLDPDEILQWAREKQKDRPKLRKLQKQGSVVAFAGLLPTGGGVGKDTWVINTAAWLASQGKTVAIVDLDPFGTLKDRLKVETTLSVDLWEERFMNITLSPEIVKNALVNIKSLKVWLLPASSEGRMQTAETIQHMGQWLPQAFDVVIWNLGSGLAGRPFFSALHQADHIFLIGAGDRAKFKSYQKTFEDYQEMVSVEPKIIFNKFYEKDAPQFFEQDFSHPVFAYALEDRRVFELNEQGKAVVLEQPRRPFSLAVQKTGREILGESGSGEEKPKKGGWRFW